MCIRDSFYVSAIYADTKIDVEDPQTGINISVSDEDFGFGLGANYQIPNSENLIRIGFESYDVNLNGASADTDKLTLTYLF